jgi:hypothetical protein
MQLLAHIISAFAFPGGSRAGYAQLQAVIINDNFKNKYKIEDVQGLVDTIIALNNVESKINKAAYNIFKGE